MVPEILHQLCLPTKDLHKMEPVHSLSCLGERPRGLTRLTLSGAVEKSWLLREGEVPFLSAIAASKLPAL